MPVDGNMLDAYNAEAARQPLAWPDPAVAHCELTTSRRMCRVYDFLIAELRR